MQKALVYNEFNANNFIAKKISNEFIQLTNNLHGSKFYKINIVLSIKESIKQELQKENSTIYNEEEFEKIFNKYEIKFLHYLKNFEKNKKNILKNTLISQYKQHCKQLKNAISFQTAMFFKNIDNKKAKSLQTLFKIKLSKLKKESLNLSKFKNNYLKTLLSISFLSITTLILFILWKFNSKITNFSKNSIHKIKICKKYFTKQNILQKNKIFISAKLYYNNFINSISTVISSINNFIGNILLYKLPMFLYQKLNNNKYSFQTIPVIKYNIPKNIDCSITTKNIDDVMQKITKEINYNIYNNKFLH